MQELIFDVPITAQILELVVMALRGDLLNYLSLNEHVSYLAVAELWHFAGRSMGLIILANLPNDSNWVHDPPKAEEGFAVLGKWLQSMGANLGATAYVHECNAGKSLCKIFFYAVTDLAPRNLQSIGRLHTCKSKHYRLNNV